MNATISMDGLLSVIESLSMQNKKWLAKKLTAAISTSKVTEEEEILSGIVRSVKEADVGKTYSLDTLWDQLYFFIILRNFLGVQKFSPSGIARLQKICRP